MSHAALRVLARVGARLPVVVDRRWPPVKVAKLWLLHRLRRERVEVGGHLLHLDPTDSLRLGLGEVHQPWLLDLVERCLGPGDRALDLGAHIGYVTLAMARRVGPHGRVFAFEPDPGNFRLLVRNLAANGYANVDARRVAVWSDHGRRRLHLRDDHHGDHRLYDPGDGREASLEVETVALDRALAGEGPFRVVKMDIQGSELEALRGMVGLLAASPEVVLVTELWPRGLRAAGAEPEVFVDELLRLGFELWRPCGPRHELVRCDPRAVLAELDPGPGPRRWLARLRSSDATDLVARSGGPPA